jgi:hypothetical protein
VQWFSGQSSAAVAKAIQTRLRCSYVEIIATNIIDWKSEIIAFVMEFFYIPSLSISR